jgi:hypothetical protein
MAVVAVATPLHAQSASAPPTPAPFGPGARLAVVSEGKPVNVFVARIDPRAAEPPPDSSFVKLGKTPLAVDLPQGSYRIEVEGVDISNESLLFEMRNEARSIRVRTGSEGLSTTGTLFMGIGLLGIVGATAILASGSKAPSKLDKASVLIPMYAAGAVCFGGGLAMSYVGSTKLEASPPARTGPVGGAWLALRASF